MCANGIKLKHRAASETSVRFNVFGRISYRVTQTARVYLHAFTVKRDATVLRANEYLDVRHSVVLSDGLRAYDKKIGAGQSCGTATAVNTRRV